MIRNLKALIICAFSLVVAAHASAKDNQQRKQPKKIVKLSHGFTLSLGNAEDFGDFVTYSYLRLSKNGATIYADKEKEYELSDKHYPLLLKAGKNSFELLLEVNDRPSKSYLSKLSIRNNRLVKTEKLPTFLTKPFDLNGDRRLVCAGFLDYTQTWDDSLTCYNPILFYVKDKSGIRLDSALTIKTNKEIYGGFYGFTYYENKVLNVKCLDRIRAVTEQIEKKESSQRQAHDIANKRMKR